MPKSSSQLKTFEEADSALRILGEAQREIEQLELECQAAIDAAKARLAEKRQSADAVAKSTTKLLSQFVRKNQAKIEARGGKTIQLHFGRLGMRTTPPALGFDDGIRESDVIYLIRREHPDLATDLIETKESVRRDALKDFLDDAQLQVICCTVKQREVVVIEPSDDVAGVALEAGAA